MPKTEETAKVHVSAKTIAITLTITLGDLFMHTSLNMCALSLKNVNYSMQNNLHFICSCRKIRFLLLHLNQIINILRTRSADYSKNIISIYWHFNTVSDSFIDAPRSMASCVHQYRLGIKFIWHVTSQSQSSLRLLPWCLCDKFRLIGRSCLLLKKLEMCIQFPAL